MNDRFKFRVWNNRDWDKDFGEVYYDAEETYDYIGGSPQIPASSFDALLDNNEWIVEQCTGLKDKNGKLIYEGDVLKCVYSEIMQYRVYWEGRGYRMRVYGSDNKIVDDCPIFVNAADVLEVIGNIHENKDLLEADNAD